ncbi:helix-turn-helix transcriptional regulator [Rugosimonospora africana]|uniref:Transcriptional regulator n=1 Tax=Rugosimonospora africana TaxID=556532 RepID=A0A8J3VP83_9ACTN|nr:helix-turn-helix transcriptional regulator [Rugosimonospora africana]GIH13692.1 transcriptional regulator [Rugosimonospora africana]
MTMPQAGVRRVELAQFLRSRRARIRPDDVGIPTGLRRRTPGLRREEVAQLAGVGVTWYTWLEQGRPINASVQILDAIARTLRLDYAERAHLYRLAEVPAVVAEDTHEELSREVQTVLDSLEPLPAVVYSGRYDLLAWNRTYAALLPGAVDAAPQERNVLWQMFTVPGCCSAMARREVELPRLVATFRAAFARHLGEPSWTGFVRRLCAASPEFARMWANHDVAGPGNQLKAFQNVLGRTLSTVSTSFAVSATPEARMVVYTPVDDQARELLKLVTLNPPTEIGCPKHRHPAGVRAPLSVAPVSAAPVSVAPVSAAADSDKLIA